MKAIIALAAIVVSFASTANAQSHSTRGPIRFCTAVAGTLYHPVTGQSVFFTNGCQQAQLLAAGFLPEPPHASESDEGRTEEEIDTRFCLQVMGRVKNPATGEVVVTSNSCEMQDLLEAGYVRL